MVRVGIVVPVLWHEGFTDLVYSIKTRHEYRVYPIQQYRYYPNHQSLAAAWNEGVSRAWATKCHFAVVCNEDILFAPQTIDQLLIELTSRPDTLLVTPNNVKNRLENHYDILTYSSEEDDVSTKPNPDFSCFLISPQYTEVVGTFDEKCVPAWYEDNDSHYRTKLAGYEQMQCWSAPIYHHGQVATHKFTNADSSRSRDHYVEKWGGMPEQEKFVRPYDNPDLTWKDW